MQPKDKPAAKVGDTVTYTAPDGQQYDAVIDALSGEMAHLTATINGATQKVSAVPHSPDGIPNSWDSKD